MLKQFYKMVFIPYIIDTDIKIANYDSRLPLYDELGNLVLEVIKNITGSKADPLFDWSSDNDEKMKKNATN